MRETQVRPRLLLPPEAVHCCVQHTLYREQPRPVQVQPGLLRRTIQLEGAFRQDGDHDIQWPGICCTALHFRCRPGDGRSSVCRRILNFLYVNNMSAELRNKAARAIQAALRKTKGGVYTNSANGFKLSKPRVYLSSVKMSVGFFDFERLEKLADGPYYFVTQIDGLTAIRSKPVYRWVYKTGPTGDFSSAKMVRLSIVFRDPEATANVLIFRNGQVVISTTGPWERVARILAQEYLPGKITKMMETAVVNANSSIFYCNRHINTMELYYQIEALIPSSVAELTSLDPVQYMGSSKLPANWVRNPQRPFEDPRALKGFKRGISVTVKNPDVSLFIFSNGTITASCLKSADAPEAFKIIMTYMDKEAILGPNRGAQGNKKEAKRVAVTNARYERAAGWNATKNGFYVRPGPNGHPRFYPLVANKSLVRAKTIRAFLNSKVNIPAATLRNLNIKPEHIAAVANSENAHNHPKNFNNQSRTGYYVRPDKQGRPRWYKIPKGIANGKKTVMAAYSKASLPVPAHIKNLFKIRNGNAAAGSTEHVINLGKNKSLRINGKQIERFNKNALLTIAANLNLPAVGNKMTIEEIRAEIQRKYAPRSQPVNVVVNNVGHTLLANGTVRRNYKNKPSRTRQFSTLKVPEQNAIARAMLNSNSYEKYKKVQTKDRFSFLLGWKNAKAANEAAKRAARPPTPSPNNSNGSPLNYRDELNFEYTLRLEQNLNNMFRNKNVKDFIARLYDRLKIGARGKFPKTNMNQEYKKFLAETKAERGNIPLKAEYRTRIEIPNWVPANKANAFRNALVNLSVSQRNGKWFYRPAENVKRAMNSWVRTHIPQSPARIARVVENVVTGEQKVIPAYEPKPRSNIKVPSPPAKAAAKPKAKPRPKVKNTSFKIPNRPEVGNLRNALVNLGLYKNTYSWRELEEAGVNKKFKSTWDRYVRKN
ncbi:hypothetical protein AR679_gp065 [Yellowstone lake phycodnavirus 1]|uniref:hypothetical protein n=1 Tax=Yellowstone lake phycodnavirus 1 TaxID=1586713 RepID=UPI0006EB8781|nr:hypothetical protein AR679_gp065 [Yellowstone lake phycodnavirus 1]BAT22091.1 hypothetical protein [Yellowstone lake phycodnavirus 1]